MIRRATLLFLVASQAAWAEPSPRPAPDRSALVATVALAGTVAGLSLLDDPLRRPSGRLEYSQDRPFFGGEGTPIERLGRPLTNFGIAGAFYLGGSLTGSESARRVGAVGSAALLADGILTLGIKNAAGRRRPLAGQGPARWDWLGGTSYESSSFPSGHSSMAFAMATVVAEEYDSAWVDALSYSLAGTVAASRIYQDQHWASDVLGGAALGWLVGKGLSRWERRSGWARSLYSDGRGLYFKKKF